MDPGNSGLAERAILSEEQYYELSNEGKEFRAEMGGEAILEPASMREM